MIQTDDITNSNKNIKSCISTYLEECLKQSKMWKPGSLCITITANIVENVMLTFDSSFPDNIVDFTPNKKVISLLIEFLIEYPKAKRSCCDTEKFKCINDWKSRYNSSLLKLKNQFVSFVQGTDKSKLKIRFESNFIMMLTQ